MIHSIVRATRWHWLFVVLLCCAIYLPGIGSTGFALTEGHRVIPGWTMLDTGDFWHLNMFDATYRRKPPAMPWAVAASAAVLGQSELSARLVSALAMTGVALLTLIYSRRWFGPTPALLAALFTVLTPWLWPSARTAEIESLNLFATTLALYPLAHLLVFFPLNLVARASRPCPPHLRSRWHSSPSCASPLLPHLTLAALGLTLTFLSKGPASLPALLALPIAAAITSRSLIPLRSPNLLIPLTAALALSAALLYPFFTHNPDAVQPDVANFLWSTDTLTRTLTLPIAALGAAMPCGAALLYPFGPHATREPTAATDPTTPTTFRLARTLAFAWLIAISIYMLLGVHNVRYTQPALPLVFPLVAYVARGCLHPTDRFTPLRQRITRRVVLGHPAVLLGLLAIGAAIYVPLHIARRERITGKHAGIELAQTLSPSTDTSSYTVWSDALIEARPETLLYAARHAADRGITLDVQWHKADIAAGTLPQPGTLIALRTDSAAQEHTLYTDSILTGALTPIYEGTVHRYTFTVYTVADTPSPLNALPD